MFCLVRYEDDVIFVVNERQLRKRHDNIFAKYTDGNFYRCWLLYSHENINRLQEMQHQLSIGCMVSIRKLPFSNYFGQSSRSIDLELDGLNKNDLDEVAMLEDNNHLISTNQTVQSSMNEFSGDIQATDNIQQPIIDETAEIFSMSEDSQDHHQSAMIENYVSNDESEISEPFSADDDLYQLSEEDKFSELSSSDSSHEMVSMGEDSEIFRNDTSINEIGVGEAIKQSTTTFVKKSHSGTKKYSCKYCGKLVAKLPRHIETVHKDLEEVKKLALITKRKREKNQPLATSALERMRLLKDIRAKGNFLHNMKCSTHEDFIPCRRPRQDKPQKTVSDYAVCSQCKETYSRATLHRHFKRCTGRCSKFNKNIQTLSRAAIGNVHENAEPQLRQIIYRMREDEVTTIVRYDELIILFGNLEAFKYRHSQHHGKMIRAKLRRLARLLLELRKIEPNITDFKSLFDPRNFSSYLKAVNNLGNFNEGSDLFDTPATAAALGMLTKELGDILIAHCIEKKDSEGKRNAEEFMHLYKLKFGKMINKTVAESQTEMRIKKKVSLPSLNDIKKLHKYLTDKRRRSSEKLTNGFDMPAWKELLETTLTSIQLLNRRRPGEIERLKIVHYKSLERIDELANLDLYANLNQNAKKIANKYSRILLRGKLNRTVPVLLNQEMIESLELLLKYRKEAKVSNSNPYLFGIPGGAANPEKWPNACDLMRKFSNECKAQVPSTLRGTLLRKHVATCCISLNLTDGEVDDLSKFMGHDKNIHMNIYRQPVATKDILEISQLLEKAQGGDTNEPDITLRNVEINENLVSVSEYNSSACSEPRENLFQDFNTPKHSKGKWDPETRAAVMNAFGEMLFESKLPSSKQIHNLIKSTPCLRHRTVPQIRTWLHNKKKVLESEKNEAPTNPTITSTTKKRNSIPSTIYLLFADNISKKKIPSLEECYTMYARSPSLNRYNPGEILNMVKDAIDRS